MMCSPQFTNNNNIKYSLLLIPYSQEILKNFAGGRGSRWLSRRMWSSPPPTNTSKYIYVWNNSHRKPTGNWQKISYATNAARKIST